MADHETKKQSVPNSLVKQDTQPETISESSPNLGFIKQSGTVTSEQVLYLQRTIGNRATQQFLAQNHTLQRVDSETKPSFLQQMGGRSPSLDNTHTHSSDTNQPPTADFIQPASMQTDQGRIQRAGGRSLQNDDIEEIGGTTLDLVGHVSDFATTDATSGVALGGGMSTGTGTTLTGGGGSQLAGGVISTGTGGITFVAGLGRGIYSGYKWAKYAGKIKEKQAEVANGEAGLYATIKVLKRKRSAARKGVAEGTGSVLGGISGLMNGIGGLISLGTGAIAEVAGTIAGAAFGAGGALGLLLGTVTAIRSFANVGKRGKKKKAIKQVMAAYASLTEDGIRDRQQEADNLANDLQDLHNEKAAAETEYNNFVQNHPNSVKRKAKRETKIQELDAKVIAMQPRVDKLNEDINTIENEFDDIDKIYTALALSKRKQGAASKVIDGILNVVSAAGGAALGVATFAGAAMAAAGGAAAAAGLALTPIGWIAGGVALVGLLSFAIGREIKQHVRKDNVKRMNQEIDLVQEYIDIGRVNGKKVHYRDANGTDHGRAENPNFTADERKDHIWTRKRFLKAAGTSTGLKKKGFFNKLFSKSKSGTLTMQQRLEELQVYLGKYDTEAAGDAVWDGFKAALTGDKGLVEIDNPSYDAAKVAKYERKNKPIPPNDARFEPKITLRKQIENLIEHFFPGKVDEFKASINEGGTKEAEAKRLLMDKMKLG